MSPLSKPATVTQYIASAAPGATQSLKWSMPAFSYDRILVTFAAFKRHIGLYPTPSAVRALIQFPLDEPLPTALIMKIVAFRAAEVRGKDAKWRVETN